jgi:enterochelin esterase-like enzyme
MRKAMRIATVLALACVFAPSAWAQDAPQKKFKLGPQFTSPEVAADGKITFRVAAPKAETVRVTGNDMPQLPKGAEMTKTDKGYWEATVGPVAGGSYRYNFNIDGVAVIDPRNPLTSESNTNTWSLVHVPGSPISDLKNVPHGAVAQVPYYATSLKRFRRMHVYTPPGYEAGSSKYPVFYLLHGATDCDNSWSTIGRAGLILDNLIAASKAKPMIVVMPAGHTGAFNLGAGGALDKQIDEFSLDFLTDIKPYVEKNYRLQDGRANRAIAGLSMGGAQTLNIAIPNLRDYAYVGVYSSGVFGIAGKGFGGGKDAAKGPSWEEKNQKILDDADAKKGLKLVWFATGKEDFLMSTTRGTVNVLKKHGFEPVFHETAGGHTWINWRQYLSDFAPLLFADEAREAKTGAN